MRISWVKVFNLTAVNPLEATVNKTLASGSKTSAVARYINEAAIEVEMVLTPWRAIDKTVLPTVAKTTKINEAPNLPFSGVIFKTTGVNKTASKKTPPLIANCLLSNRHGFWGLTDE